MALVHFFVNATQPLLVRMDMSARPGCRGQSPCTGFKSASSIGMSMGRDTWPQRGAEHTPQAQTGNSQHPILMELQATVADPLAELLLLSLRSRMRTRRLRGARLEVQRRVSAAFVRHAGGRDPARAGTGSRTLRIDAICRRSERFPIAPHGDRSGVEAESQTIRSGWLLNGRPPTESGLSQRGRLRFSGCGIFPNSWRQLVGCAARWQHSRFQRCGARATN